MKKYVLATLLLAASLGACKEKPKDAKPLPPPSAAALPEVPQVGPPRGSEQPAGDGATETASAVVSGTLQAREEVSVGAKVSGTILSISVDENSRVKKGQVLFQIDSRDAQLMRKQAQNQLAGAELQLKTAQREYDRMKGLVGQNAVPQQQLDQLEAQVEGARLQIAAARNSIAMASKTIGDAAARSPIAGVVTRKLMSAGEYATMMPPSPVVIVQDQSALELKFRLPERTLSSVQQGDAVAVSIPSLGQTRAATVGQISPVIDPRTRTIELTAVLDNCDGGLRPGLAAEVKLGAPEGEVTAPACGKPAKKAAAGGGKKAAP